MSATQQKSILQSITLDVFKHILSFSSAPMISTFSTTCKEAHFIVRKFYLDTVHHIAIDVNGCYQIQSISFDEKERKPKDLIKMICTNGNNKSIQYLLANTLKINTWAKFVPKYYRLHQLHKIKGYWKLLNHNNDPIITDLNAIKSLVMHKQIAPTLLKYDSHKHNENPFHNKITVSIKNNTYDILFWNGASPNQYNTFQIYDHQKGKNHYYMNFRSDMLDLKWMWYDNDSSLFREYSLGETVKQQIECSFQANLLYNFPMEFQKDNIFNDVNLNALKKELIREYGHQNKLFALRCGFDEIYDINRSIINVQQLTVSINGCYGFSRTIERKHNNKTDFCKYNQNNFNLRMKPLELVDIKEEKSVF
eukprot:417917_1